MDIQEAIEFLAKARQAEANHKEEVAEIQAELEASALWQVHLKLKDALAGAREDVSFWENRVRVMTLDAFRQNGDKTPHPAVQIKMYTTLTYDTDDALAYAREHLPGALKLVKGVFEKAAKAVEPDFVTIGQEPRATIARDLSEYGA